MNILQNRNFLNMIIINTVMCIECDITTYRHACLVFIMMYNLAGENVLNHPLRYVIFNFNNCEIHFIIVD